MNKRTPKVREFLTPSEGSPSQPVPRSMLIALPAARSNSKQSSHRTLHGGRSPNICTFDPPRFSAPEPAAPGIRAGWMGSRSSALTCQCCRGCSFIHSEPSRASHRGREEDEDEDEDALPGCGDAPGGCGVAARGGPESRAGAHLSSKDTQGGSEPAKSSC